MARNYQLLGPYPATDEEEKRTRMNTTNIRLHGDAVKAAGEMLELIATLAADEQREWGGSSCEISMVGVNSRTVAEDHTITIGLHLFSHGKMDFALDHQERERCISDDKRAKAFTHRLIRKLHAEAMRSSDDPGKLMLTVGNVAIEITGYPTAVSYSCEKTCVAVLPDGKRVPMKDVPLEL